MAEALAIVGLVSTIVQLVDFGSKIVRRLRDFHSSVNAAPKMFQDIKVVLPLLLNTLKRTQAQAESGAYSRETQEALFPVVEGCRSQVELLDNILLFLRRRGETGRDRGPGGGPVRSRSGAAGGEKRHKNNYSAIFWLNIKDEDFLKQSFIRMARQILADCETLRRASPVRLLGHILDQHNDRAFDKAQHRKTGGTHPFTEYLEFNEGDPQR
jgi:hypothetical protein